MDTSSHGYEKVKKQSQIDAPSVVLRRRMQLKGRVSIIIPTMEGREKLLERALNSAKRQTYQNKEIIVINEGLSAQEQRSMGVRNSSGKYIAFLDDDDYWIDDKYLEIMISHIERDNLAMISCAYYDERIQKKRIPNAITATDLLVSFSNFETSATVFTRESYEKAGGLDLSLKSEHNHDLFYRIAKQGKIGIIPKVMVVKGYTGKNIGTNRINKLQGYIKFHWKYRKDIMSLPFKRFIFIMVKFLATILLFILFGNKPRIYEKVMTK